MKINTIDGLLLAVVGGLFINLSFDTSVVDWLGLIVGCLLMVPGVYQVVRFLWQL